MKFLLPLLSAVSLLSEQEILRFQSWVTEHGKVYTGTTEFLYRADIYHKNLKKIAEHNRGNHTWTMAPNAFADLTAEEFGARMRGGYRGLRRKSLTAVAPAASLRGAESSSNTSLPASIDWTELGAVTPVKNQQQCGSCWSFSSTGAVEGAWFLAKQQLVSLSEQQLIDCSTAEGNQGCNGGMMDYAFQYIISNGGITTEAEYPYTATGPNTCEAAGKPVAASITSYTDVTPSSDAALMAALAKQPVSVAIEADQSSFQFYSGGVMTAACGTQLDHGVLAVGYGTESGQDFYKVKNSWGADWGMNGYILLGRGSAFAPNGQCGILMDPSYPVV